MIDYEQVIAAFNRSVSDYCVRHNIKDFQLKNLRVGDVPDYRLYAAYKQATAAIVKYRYLPESSVYAKDMLVAVKNWYAVVNTGSFRGVCIQAAPKRLFAVFLQKNKQK